MTAMALKQMPAFAKTIMNLSRLPRGVHPRLQTTTSTRAFVVTCLEIEYSGPLGPAIAALRLDSGAAHLDMP